MKVNIVSNNSIIRAIPGTKHVTPVYGIDLSEVQIIRILNFPALRVYDVASGAIVTKKNINSILNGVDKGISPKEVECYDCESECHLKPAEITLADEVEQVEVIVEEDTVVETVDTEPVVEETVDAEPVVDEVVCETSGDVVETEEVKTVVETEEVETVDAEPVVETVDAEEVVTKPAPQNANRKKNNKNRH